MKGKIIQIIPAPSNPVIVSTVEGEAYEEPALCLALTNQGEVVIMHMDGAGLIDEAHEAIDTDGFKWK
jgi:hypothetical protein